MMNNDRSHLNRNTLNDLFTRINVTCIAMIKVFPAVITHQ